MVRTSHDIAPTRTLDPYSTVTSGRYTVSETQRNRAGASTSTASDGPQSNRQSAGFGGGDQSRSTMSQRTQSTPIAHETFPDGVENHVGSVISTSDVVVDDTADEPVVLDEVVVDEEPPRLQPRTAVATSATTNSPITRRSEAALAPIRTTATLPVP